MNEKKNVEKENPEFLRTSQPFSRISAITVSFQ